MTTELTENPTVAQRLVAMELQQLRRAAGMERKRAAQELGCAVSKISHIENARNQPSYQDLEVLTRLYGRADRLPILARRNDLGHRRGWWQNAKNPDLHGPDSFGEYVGLEQGTRLLQIWEPMVINGQFQTFPYAHRVISTFEPNLTPEQLHQLAQVRMRRQEIVDKATLHVVLAHNALRPIGSPQDYHDQIQRLIDAANHPHVTLQMLPDTVGVHPGQHGPFTIMHFPADPEVHDPGLVYAETLLSGIWYDEAHQVAAYSTKFQQLTDMALTPEHTLDYLQNTLKEHP